jgi:hypothetical protein
VLSDEVLAPLCDHICREEGVAWFRRLLGEAPRAMPYRHPLVVSNLRLFGMSAGRTGMIFGGLGCANGCDFCCASHYFGRRHLKLLPTGRDIFAVVERYLALDASMSFTVLESGRALSLFAFASMRAISRYAMTELVEMGIDGLWIGYEGTRSGYGKRLGEALRERKAELVLDFDRLQWDPAAAFALLNGLLRYRKNIALVLPALRASHPEVRCWRGPSAGASGPDARNTQQLRANGWVCGCAPGAAEGRGVGAPL